MPVEIRVPPLGDSVVEATIAKWLKQQGDTIATGDVVVELETDKVNVEVPAEQGGVLTRIDRQEGDTVGVGDVLGALGEAVPAGSVVETPAPASEAPPVGASGEGRPPVPVSPVARALAEETNLDLRLVQGTGSGGRITKDDVATHIERTAQAPATANTLARQSLEPSASAQAAPPPPSQPAPAPAQPAPAQTAAPAAQPAAPAPSGDRPEERVRLSRRRQTIATRLVEAQHTAAMLTTFNEVDMTAVMDLRKRRRDSFKERHGVGLGFMSFFTRAVIGALKSFPLLNAEIDGTDIVMKRYYDIGVAVSTEEGLVVPVLRNADRLSFAGIEKGIAELAVRARDGKLTLSELQGGTFTITNGGVFGSLLSTPILNAPQVGILGMHKIEERPVAVNGAVVIRPMMYLALSYDHRIVDGREAVSFLVRVKELIEDPESLLLEG